MGSIGAPEILVILLVALIVLGPSRLPEAARQMGRALAELRRMSAGFQAEMRDALQEGAPAPAPSTAPTATPSGASGDERSDQKYLWEDLPTSAESPPKRPGDDPSEAP